MLFSIDFFGLVCLAPLFLIWEGDIYRLKTIILLKIKTYIYVVRIIHEHSSQRCQSFYSSPNNHQWSPNQWAVFNQQNITAASMYIHTLFRHTRFLCSCVLRFFLLWSPAEKITQYLLNYFVMEILFLKKTNSRIENC